MTDQTQDVKTLRVMYSDEWRTWYVSRYDAEDNQIGESEYHYRLSTAKAVALRERNEQGWADAVVEVYFRDGGLREVL